MVNGKARGIVTRNMVTGAIESHAADCVVLATGGYSQRFLSFDQREGVQHARPSGGRIAAARCSPIPASRRFTRRAFR